MLRFSNEEINKAYLLAALSGAMSGRTENVPTGNIITDTLDAFPLVGEVELAEALKVVLDSQSLTTRDRSSKNYSDSDFLAAAKEFLK